MHRLVWLWIVLIITCESNTLTDTSINESSQSYLFKEVSSAHSGITFQNQLIENLSTGENILDFDFFFNGAGVAAADFDNDGLEDLFFTANQVDNRIYKNEGGLQFTDKTETAGIRKSKFWSNGVTCADVNEDGFMDIYVSQGGPYGPEKRANLLYINNGDFTFTESAKAYGLADIGISTQTAFFDFDKDGDLDCIVMNESPLIGLDPVSFYSMIKTHNASLLGISSSHLYRNDGGKFVDVTEQAGLLLPSFGLGLSVSDINNDGWLDIYIANDYYIPDAVYINDKKGGFINETKDRLQHSAFFSMGLDIADINQDGYQDIYVLDMASEDHIKSKTLMASMDVDNFNMLTQNFDFPYQYMFNAMQLNNGQHKFDNIAHFSKTSKTDWSWACLIEDFDKDGNKDIFVSNGFRKYTRDNDFQIRVKNLKQKYGDQAIPLIEKEALYKTVPSEKIPNVFYRQTTPLQFENVSAKMGLGKASFSNGAVHADLDNDGDLDLIVNNIDDEAFLYENTSDKNGFHYLKVKLDAKLSEPFAKVWIYYGDKVQMAESKRVRGYLSSLSTDIYFGLGEVNNIDSLVVKWLDGKSEKITAVAVDQTISLKENAAVSLGGAKNSIAKKFKTTQDILPTYKHVDNGYNDFRTETLLPYKQSITGPKMRLVEKSNEAEEAIFIGASQGQSPLLASINKNVNTSFEVGLSEIADAIFFDLDNDGDEDAYLLSAGNEAQADDEMYMDHLFINDNGLYTESGQSSLNPGSSGKTGASFDFDKDGDNDLIICNRIIPQKYPQHAPSILFKNDNGKLIDVTNEKAPGLSEFGIINDIEVMDFNDDGWMDFMVAGEWTSIGLFQNKEGVFENVSSEYDLDAKLGWWFSIIPTDLNNDGKMDYILGNLGLNSKYKASDKKPLYIYGHDFDDNGTYDQILSYEYKGKQVPFRGRQCSSEQVPFIKEKFPTYESFANATLQDVYGAELGNATQKKATTFASTVLIQTDNGFRQMELPIEAHLRPILDGVSIDIDKNGFEDLILIGNIYETEVETPRLDYQNATVLLSDGKQYTYSANYSSQLPIEGNSKSIVLLESKGKASKILIGVNDEKIREFTILD